MYVSTDDLDFDLYYQGDIVTNFPFFIFKNPNVLKDDGSTVELEGNVAELNEEFTLTIKGKLTQIAILSQTCDVQQRENVIVAPVYSIKSFEDEGILADGKAGLIKKRRIAYWFYLPAMENVLEDSLIDFQTIYYLPVSLLNSYKKNKIITMSDWGRHHLGWALSNYFGRPIEDKNS